MAENYGSSRNFRSAYYEKLGFCGNDEKNCLDLLIASSPFDIEKLSELCERFDIDRNCIEAWKVLLGVECSRKNPFDEYANVRRVRAEHFQSLKHHLEVLLRHSLVMRDRWKKCSNLETKQNDLPESSLLEEIKEDQSRLITLMYLLEAGRLDSTDVLTQLNSDHCRKLSAMASFFLNVSADLQEAFFIFRNFTRELEENDAFNQTPSRNKGQI